MLKFINFSTKFVIAFVLVLLIFSFSTFWYFSIGLPDYKKLSNYQPPISSRVYSDDGKLIAEYALQKRLFVPYESIPDKVINSFLSAEDKNFFNHPGVDAKGILRAVIKNLKNISQNKRLEGASTITQQVAKNFLLTNEVSLKSLTESGRRLFVESDVKEWSSIHLTKGALKVLSAEELKRQKHEADVEEEKRDFNKNFISGNTDYEEKIDLLNRMRRTSTSRAVWESTRNAP